MKLKTGQETPAFLTPAAITKKIGEKHQCSTIYAPKQRHVLTKNVAVTLLIEFNPMDKNPLKQAFLYY